MTRKCLVAGAIALMVGALAAGCTASPEASSKSSPSALPTVDLIDVAYLQEHATSDFEKEVVADGKVTHAEYVEANQLWLECMQQEFPVGTQPTIGIREQPNGLIDWVMNSVDEADEERMTLWADKCSFGTTELVGVYFNDLWENPDGKSLAQQLFECLDAKGLVPDGYTVFDFDRDFNSDAASQTFNEIHAEVVKCNDERALRDVPPS